MDAFCWIDIETTGLNPDRDYTLEIGVKITDIKFSDLYSFHFWVTDYRIFPPDLLDPFIVNMHTQSGLFDEADRVDPQDFYNNKGYVQLDIDFAGHLDFIRKSRGIDTLYPAGSTVDFDLSFLRALGLRETLSHLHHRKLDVTSLKLFMYAIQGFIPEFPEIEPKHRALSDIESSLLVAKTIAIPGIEAVTHAEHLQKVIESRMDDK